MAAAKFEKQVTKDRAIVPKNMMYITNIKIAEWTGSWDEIERQRKERSKSNTKYKSSVPKNAVQRMLDKNRAGQDERRREKSANNNLIECKKCNKKSKSKQQHNNHSCRGYDGMRYMDGLKKELAKKGR